MKRLEQKQARRWRRRWPWNTRAYRWLYKHVIEPNATW